MILAMSNRSTLEQLAGFTLGQTKGPTQPQQLSPEYQEALEWTRQNPNDPRTPGILKKIGVQ